MRKDTKDTAELEEPIEVDDLEVPMPMSGPRDLADDADLLEDDDEDLGEVALVDDLDEDDDEVVVGATGVGLEVEIVPIETRTRRRRPRRRRHRGKSGRDLERAARRCGRRGGRGGEAPDSEERGEGSLRVLPKQPGEFVCRSCS